MARSIEERIENWCKDQLKGLFKIKTEPINQETEDALKKYPSKQGGKGTNYPDLKMLIQWQGRNIPVMIEVKGTKGALVKMNTETNTPDNLKKDGTPNFQNIAKYAVNGAVHYADAILKLTKSYKEVVAVGVNGEEQKDGTTHYEIGVWYVSKDNLFVPKEVAKFSDLSFLQPKHQADFIKQIDSLSLSEQEKEREKLKLEDDIERKIKELNQKMQDESEYKIEVNQRVQLITGLIMAGLGVEGKVSPLQVEDLRGDNDKYNNDGAIIMRKIHSYLEEKKLPQQKIEMINNVLYGVFIDARLYKAEDGESKLKKIYIYTQENIIPFLTGELHNLDFTGRLFNVLNAWVAVPDGGANDVVLTPRYVTELMTKLCQVNKDSYVWDFATGSGGFLISAMHQMIADAKATIESPEELRRKINHIKMEQLLGIEILGSIYMLAVLNMILMKDGSANIIHGNSLTEFDGNYSQGAKVGEEFPANVFMLNPPYSAPGKGMIFVERALSMMHRGGRAAVLIQENAGDKEGVPYTTNILKSNTLLASIKMTEKLFIGKSAVQTAIYVFEVGRPHNTQDVVKFIDFTEDGYSRQNKKKSSQNVNLRDTDDAKGRYNEIIKVGS